jgi:hypothetical protein
MRTRSMTYERQPVTATEAVFAFHCLRTWPGEQQYVEPIMRRETSRGC